MTGTDADAVHLSRSRHPHRAGLRPDPLHALPGGAGVPGRHRGRRQADRSVRPPPRGRHVLRALSTDAWRRVLLLFDVDGTLLGKAVAAHRDALHDALREVHGVEVTDVRTTLAPAGRTDGEIARALLLAAGVSARRIDERAEAVREACCRAYAQLCRPFAGRQGCCRGSPICWTGWETREDASWRW